MGKAHFCFGASFFVLATTGTLLFTWTCWWLAVVGPSVPARRPFFRPESEVPQLIITASDSSKSSVFVNSLAGGWPTPNSAIRLLAALCAVLCSFSFAFVASLMSQHAARLIFSVCLSITAVVALVATIMDAVSIVKTARECSDGACVTAVPAELLKSQNTCMCAVDAWFYCTLGVDVLLVGATCVCLCLTVSTWMQRRGLDPSRLSRRYW